jgi:hypothetical protein
MRTVAEAGRGVRRMPAALLASLALIVALLLLAFGLGTAVSAAYEALEDMQGRGEMDPTWL